MATCSSCGSEMTGQYCNSCGARAPEERSTKKAKAQASKPAHAPASRTPGLLSPQRIWRTVAVGLLGIVVYGAGIFTGVYMTQTGAGSSLGIPAAADASTGDPDIDALPPLARANFYMESGVALMNEGQRSAAISEFRKSLAQWEVAIQAEPDNLYAHTYQGLTYYYAGDSQKALTTLRGVLEKDPNYLWAIFNLAWIYETAGKKTEAQLMYQKYVAVAETEKQNNLKYAEQYELIDRQLEAAKAALEKLSGGGTGK